MTIDLIPLIEISKDIRNASRSMTSDEARFLVDTYYQVQDYRQATANQLRSIADNDEPNDFLEWVFGSLQLVERHIRNGLNRYTDEHEIGIWSKSITGIGPVIAAGLMAHIDIAKAPSVAHIWRFAGLDPTSTWNKGEKRPWNADLRTLCWKIGESFNKNKNRANDQYGHLIDKRKRYEWGHNIAGLYTEQAQRGAERVGKTTDAYQWYSGAYALTEDDLPLLLEGGTLLKGLLEERKSEHGVPMLPPGHIHSRSKRFAVKMYISHWHAVAYELHYGVASPQPYAIAHLGHVDYIPAPNWPME